MRIGQGISSNVVATHLGVFLVSWSVMALELSLTRILSVFLAYQYVFLVLSVAILGLGLGSLLVYRKRLVPLSSSSSLRAAAAFSGVGALVSLVALVLLVRLTWFDSFLIYLAMATVVFLPPGMVLGLVFARFVKQSSSLYWSNLFGAGSGVLLALPLLGLLGGIGTAVLGIVALSLAGVAFSLPTSPRQLAANLAGVAVLGWALVLTATGQGLDLEFRGIRLADKPMTLELNDPKRPASIVYSDWDAFARTDVVELPSLPDEKIVYIDGGSGSVMYRYPEGPVAALKRDIGFFPFTLKEPGKTLIIGPGGGKDVLLALLGGSRDITAVELNQGTVRAVRRFADFNGGVYDLPGVKTVVGEGRNYLRRSLERFDTIYLSLTVAQAAEMNGLALSENYLYTVEAFQDYLDHLTPQGQVIFKLHDERDLTRAFVTAVAAISRKGESTAQATRHLAMFSDKKPAVAMGHGASPMYPLLILRREPISPFGAGEMKGRAIAAGLTPLFVPHLQSTGPFVPLAEGQQSLPGFIQGFTPARMTPVSDDQPFFYFTAPGLPGTLWSLLLLLGLLVAWGYPSLSRGSGAEASIKAKLVPYFSLLGAGFMLVEISLIQRLTLFIGHPTTAMATVIFLLLASGGLGSLLSGRVPSGKLPRLVALASLGAGLLTIAVALLVPQLVALALAWHLTLRLGLAGLLIFPLGLLLGIPFPSGLRMAKDLAGPGTAALMWGVNGIMTVAGSALGIAVAILWGFSWSQLLGGAAYLGVAALVAWGWLRHKPPERGTALRPAYAVEVARNPRGDR
ncbi:MAG: hypothetical protein AB1566_00500 [Chloroflexota bacterium]